MKIFLIGYRGTGKTTIGKPLARHLGFGFMDTDHLIEQQLGSTVLEIIETRGWEKFRQVEKQILLNLKNEKNSVIATGGGIIMDIDNQLFLKKNGFCIWLDADINTILHRLHMDNNTNRARPSLTRKKLSDETDEMVKKRFPMYENTAHMRIDTSFHTPEEILNIIDRRLKDVWQ